MDTRLTAKNSPLVSVVMPVFNSTSTLPWALASVLAQTYPHWELIVVDDGSTDHPELVLNALDDSRIRLIRLPENQGRGYARQVALDLTRGKYICMLDADDWMYPERLEAQVTLLERHEEVTLVSAGLAVVDSDQHMVGVRSTGDGRVRGPFVGVACPVANSLSMFRKAEIGSLRYDHAMLLGEDADFLVRLLQGRQYVVIGRVMYAYGELRSVTAAKAASAMAFERHRARKHLRRARREAVRMIVRSYAKEGAYRAVSLLGLDQAMLRRRSHEPSEAEQIAHHQARQRVAMVVAERFPSLTGPESGSMIDARGNGLEDDHPRIMHVTTVPQSLGFLRGQIGYMKDRGFQIEATSSPGDKLVDFGATEGIPVYPVDLPRRITPIHDLRAVRNLVRILRRQNPMIVHAHTPKGGLLGMVSAWLTRTPVRSYHIRGLPYMTATGHKRTLLKSTEWLSCRLAHRVFCVSHSIREAAIADGICPADRIVVFGGGSGNGVNADDRFNPGRFSEDDRKKGRMHWGLGAEELVIGFVGRIVRDKGIEELAASWTVLRDRYPNLRLVLVGPTELQDPVSPDTLQMFQDDPQVVMLGSVDDTSKVYPLLDLVVLPTYREGFPNVPLEAAAMGLPVVATNIPGCIDAVEDGVTGTLVPPRDAMALANAIGMYLNDRDLRERHGKAGRERVLREFRQEVIWEATYQEYCQLLKEKGQPGPVAWEVASP